MIFNKEIHNEYIELLNQVNNLGPKSVAKLYYDKCYGSSRLQYYSLSELIHKIIVVKLIESDSDLPYNENYLMHNLLIPHIYKLDLFNSIDAPKLERLDSVCRISLIKDIEEYLYRFLEDYHCKLLENIRSRNLTEKFNKYSISNLIRSLMRCKISINITPNNIHSHIIEELSITKFLGVNGAINYLITHNVTESEITNNSELNWVNSLYE